MSQSTQHERDGLIDLERLTNRVHHARNWLVVALNDFETSVEKARVARGEAAKWRAELNAALIELTAHLIACPKVFHGQGGEA